MKLAGIISCAAISLLLCSLAGCGGGISADGRLDSAITPPPAEKKAVLEEREGVTYLLVNGYEMILVNKQYHLPPGYGDGITPEAQDAYDLMAAAAADAGYPIWIVSGFRSYETQQQIFERNSAEKGEDEANTFSARPGQSEHQTGLAFDLAGSEGHVLSESFGETGTFGWLAENAADYGFILRYLEGKTHATGYVYEPWHFRYVGVGLARILSESGLSVEEYAGLA
jgi:D-alanyl-D-alanine carboxypeptidase